MFFRRIATETSEVVAHTNAVTNETLKVFEGKGLHLVFGHVACLRPEGSGETLRVSFHAMDKRVRPVRSDTLP